MCIALLIDGLFNEVSVCYSTTVDSEFKLKSLAYLIIANKVQVTFVAWNLFLDKYLAQRLIDSLTGYGLDHGGRAVTVAQDATIPALYV